jgi:LruC domain-containing protein
MFLVRWTPEDAAGTVAPIPVATESPDPDGDGVSGLSDAYPTDPERAFVVRVPATGYQAIAYEDTYPGDGDKDFNDAVVEYAYDQVLRADGKLKELVGTFHLVARGAGLHHEFGVALRGISGKTTGSVELECFTSAGEHTLGQSQTMQSMLIADDDFTSALRIPVFADTMESLPDTNTSAATPTGDPASCRFVAVFDSPIDTALIGAAPYDAYLSAVHPDGKYDIHFPGRTGFSDRPESLPVESGAQSFTDSQGYPWALLVPSDFRFPLERMRIDDGGAAAPYPTFSSWRATDGVAQTTWYRAPNTSASPAKVSAAVDPTKLVHPWTIDR